MTPSHSSSRAGALGVDAWYPVVRGPVRCERVVECDGSLDRTEASAAWNELAPGDLLQVVVRSSRGLLRGMLARAGRPSPVRRWVKTLAGVHSCERFFVMPNTGGGHLLLDAQPRHGFVAGTRMLPAGRRRWRIVRRLFAALARFGLQDWMGLDEVALVRKQGAAATTELPRWSAPPFPGSTLTVSSGVPGPFQTTVIQIALSSGEIHAYVKLSQSDAAAELVAREGEVLSKLRSFSFETADVPRLLGSGRTGSSAYIVQEALEGSRSPDEPRVAHMKFLEELEARTHLTRRLDEIESVDEACERLRRLERRSHAEELETLRELERVLRRRLEHADIRCSLAHGDFTPWNLVVNGERLGVFDWEYARYESPALHDLFHFLIQTDVLVVYSADVLTESRAPHHILRKIESIVTGPAAALTCAAESSGVSWKHYLALYLFDITLRDEWINAQERPPFEQVQWLRKARLDLIGLVLQELAAEPVPAGEEWREALAWT